MNRIKLLLLFITVSFGTIPYVTVPIRINDQTPPQVVSIDINNDSVKSRVDVIIDTANKTRDTVAYYLNGSNGFTGTGKIVKSTSGTLTSATLSSPTISGPTLTGTLTNSGTISGGTVNATTLQQGGVQAVTTTGTQTLTNKTLTIPWIGGDIYFNSSTGMISSGSGAWPLNFGINGIEKMRLSSAGLFGVNTSTPDSQLTVVGSGRFSGNVTVGGVLTQGAVPVVTTTGTQTLNNKTMLSPTLNNATVVGTLNLTSSDYISGGLIQADSIWANGEPVVTTTRMQTLSNKTIPASNISNGTFKSAAAYIFQDKLGLGNATPDSTLTVTGSGKFSGNLEVGGKIETNGNEAFDYDEGEFTLTAASGFTTTPACSVKYVRIGKHVTLRLKLSMITGTANAGLIELSPLPASLQTTSARSIGSKIHFGTCVDNSAAYACEMAMYISDQNEVNIRLRRRDNTLVSAWTASGNLVVGQDQEWGIITYYVE